MRAFDLVAVGELLYALRTPYSTLLGRTRSLTCHCTGAEANVAIGAAGLGLKSAFISKVCRNFIGRFMVKTLRGHGVDTRGILRTDEGRMGVLYQEYGIAPRPSRNVYDRSGSAFLTLTPEEIDWSILDGARCVYVSGVTAALGEGPRNFIRETFSRAKEKGILMVFDGNFRSALWPADEADAFMNSILEHVDGCFIKKEDAEALFTATYTNSSQLQSRIRR